MAGLFDDVLNPKKSSGLFDDVLAPAKKKPGLATAPKADFSGVTGGVNTGPTLPKNMADLLGNNSLDNIVSKFSSSALGGVIAPALDFLSPDAEAGDNILEQNINTLKKFGIGLEDSRQSIGNWLGKTFDTRPKLETPEQKAKYEALIAKERGDLAGWKESAAKRDIEENIRRISQGLPTLEMESADMIGNKSANTLREISSVIDNQFVTSGQRNADQELSQSLDAGVVPLIKQIASNPIDSAISIGPSSAAYLLPAAGVGRLSKLVGLDASATSLAGRAAVGGTTTLSTADQSAQSVMQASEDELMLSPEYVKLLDLGAAPEQARSILAQRAYSATLPASAAANTLAAGFKPGNVLEDLATAGKLGNITGSRAGAAAIGGAGEFITEAGQESGDQLSSNIGQVVAGLLQPENLDKNLVSSGALGGIAGGLPGLLAGLGGKTNSSELNPEVIKNVIETIAPLISEQSPPVTEATAETSVSKATAPAQVEPIQKAVPVENTQDLDALLAERFPTPPP